MEKVNLSEYLTIPELQDALGCSMRAVWRAIGRVGRDKCCIRFLNATLVRKSMVETIRQHYYPFYSDAHQSMVKQWGAQGGRTKAANAADETARKKAERAAKPKRPRGRPRKNAQ